MTELCKYQERPTGGQRQKAHRPRAAWHNYRERGIYLITIVTHQRKRVLGELNRNPRDPQVILTKLGQYVEKQWLLTPALQAERGRQVRLLGHQVMPDHFHGILAVDSPLPVGMGVIVRDFKAACTREYRRLCQPSLADSGKRLNGGGQSDGGLNSGGGLNGGGPDREALQRMSHKQREAYYASHGIEPLFDENYDDTVCFRKGQLDNIINYVSDNPRRAVMRAVYPDLFSRRQHITIAGQDYSAYGNLFLLRRPWKEPVMCHRWRMIDGKRDYNTPYETTPDFQQERQAWLTAAQDGAVLVTPGISKGEKQIVNDCIEQQLPLIHLQDKPIAAGWNPEKRRHSLCEAGRLLIVVPWQLDHMGDCNGIPSNTAYSRFHHMNQLAEAISNEQLSFTFKHNLTPNKTSQP